MIEIAEWMNEFVKKLTATFAGRVWFVGLQGSYGRGEATESSDIDVVVILDELSGQDIAAYGAMLDTLPYRELICGFLSGKQEILKWEPSDLFQFCQDTIPIKGSLEEVLAGIGPDAVDRAVKIGACNLYHGCVHNMLHKKSEHTLRNLYKSAAFTVRVIYYRQTGRYIHRHGELLELVSGEERLILETALRLKNGEAVNFEEMSNALFVWAGKWIRNT